MELVLGAIGGAIVAKVAKKVIPTTVNAKYVAIGEVVLGGGVVMFAKKSAFLKGAGLGLAAAGSLDTLSSFGLIAGVGGMGKPIVFTTDGRGVNGFRDVPKIGGGANGFPTPSAIGRRKINMAGMYAGIYG